MSIDQYRAELARLLGEESVRWDEESLVAHRRDTWSLSVLRSMRDQIETAPFAVVSPMSTAEVAAALAFANRNQIPVVPFGAGSGVCGGVLPDRNALVIDLRRMNRILELNETGLYTRVQAGMMGGVFEAELNEKGYTARHFPQSIDLSTVGGWVATRAAGQYSTRYGNVEDILLALEAVLPDGTIVRTKLGPRAATGPDLRHVFLGSEGALGIVTEVTYRVLPVPESTAMLSFLFPSMHDGLEAIRLFMRAGWRPPVVRLYDGTETTRLFPSAANGDNCLLLLLSEGPEAMTRAESEACAAICRANGGSDSGAEPVERWVKERNHVPTFESLYEKGLVVDTIEVAVTWERIDELYSSVIAALQTVPGILAASGHSSHSYAQGTNIYFTFVAYPSDKTQAEATYMSCWEKAMEATLACGGTIAHHHGIGRLRAPWMGRELHAGLDVLRTLKRALDPNGIMNPGVLLPD